MIRVSSPISGFTAVPNPYMIPLLFLQSLLIGAGFGIGYQGERRKLSAMSNEDFNEVDLGMLAFDEFKGILARNDFGKMLDLMHPLTDKLAIAFGDLLNKFPEIFKNFAAAAGGSPPPPPSSTDFGGSSIGGFSGGLPSVGFNWKPITDAFGSVGNWVAALFDFDNRGKLGHAAKYYQALKAAKQANNQDAIRQAQEAIRRREQLIRQAKPFENLKPIEKKDITSISQSKARYDNLIKIRDTAKRMMVARRILYKKWLRIVQKTKSSSAKSRAQIHLRKALSLFRDAEKKYHNAIRLLRNYR